jgi:excisionase family DNA binding protein
MNEPTMPALRTPGQAAQWLGLSPSSVYRAVRLGRLAAVRPLGTGEVRFRLADLEAFVDSLTPTNEAAAPAGCSPEVEPAGYDRAGSHRPVR